MQVLKLKHAPDAVRSCRRILLILVALSLALTGCASQQTKAKSMAQDLGISLMLSRGIVLTFIRTGLFTGSFLYTCIPWWMVMVMSRIFMAVFYSFSSRRGSWISSHSRPSSRGSRPARSGPLEPAA